MSDKRPDLPPELKPEVIEHASVEFPAPNLTNHRWRQHGIHITCNTCPFAHGFTVTTDQLLAGIDESGYPVLKSISGTR